MQVNQILKSEMDGPALATMSSVSLAFVGDSVFDLYIRTRIVGGHHTNAKNMNRMATSYAKATAQAQMLERIVLSQAEADVVRRARNTRLHTIPKSATPAEYQAATALEALIGWLYLSGREERLKEILDLCFEKENT